MRRLKNLNKKKKKRNWYWLIKSYKRKRKSRLKKKNEIKPKSKPKLKSKPKSKPKQRPIPKQKIKIFDEDFQECIKNKTIPKDTPHYLKKALERAIKEYDKGIKHEKSALSNFAEKYVFDGKPGLTPLQYFVEIVTQLKEFLRNPRNIKVRMIMVCEMERQIIEKSKGKSKINFDQDKAYFQSETHINLEKTDVKVILSRMLREIMINLADYQKNGSGWYFKEVIRLEIHTVDYKPMEGSSFIPLPEFIKRKKAIINMENKDDKCFLWSVLRYLHPQEKHSTRSKVIWLEQGEKPTKYFFNLEKTNYEKKLIREVKLENGEVTSDSMRIEKELEKYFANMYASKTNDTTGLREGNSFESFVEGLEIPKLDKEDNESLEQELTVEELKKALNGFSENKTPGEDGFTKEFYETFFDLVWRDMLNSYNAAFETGSLSVSQRRGTITLIPKSDGNRLRTFSLASYIPSQCGLQNFDQDFGKEGRKFLAQTG